MTVCPLFLYPAKPPTENFFLIHLVLGESILFRGFAAIEDDEIAVRQAFAFKIIQQLLEALLVALLAIP